MNFHYIYVILNYNLYLYLISNFIFTHANTKDCYGKIEGKI